MKDSVELSERQFRHVIVSNSVLPDVRPGDVLELEDSRSSDSGTVPFSFTQKSYLQRDD